MHECVAIHSNMGSLPLATSPTLNGSSSLRSQQQPITFLIGVEHQEPLSHSCWNADWTWPCVSNHGYRELMSAIAMLSSEVSFSQLSPVSTDSCVLSASLYKYLLRVISPPPFPDSAIDELTGFVSFFPLSSWSLGYNLASEIAQHCIFVLQSNIHLPLRS